MNWNDMERCEEIYVQRATETGTLILLYAMAAPCCTTGTSSAARSLTHPNTHTYLLFCSLYSFGHSPLASRLSFPMDFLRKFSYLHPFKKRHIDCWMGRAMAKMLIYFQMHFSFACFVCVRRMLYVILVHIFIFCSLSISHTRTTSYETLAKNSQVIEMGIGPIV